MFFGKMIEDLYLNSTVVTTEEKEVVVEFEKITNLNSTVVTTEEGVGEEVYMST